MNGKRENSEGVAGGQSDVRNGDGRVHERIVLLVRE